MDKLTYDFSLDEKGIISHLKSLKKEKDLFNKFMNLDMTYHTLDVLTFKLCPNIGKCKDDEEIRELLDNYIFKLEYLNKYGFNTLGFVYDIRGREENMMEKLETRECFSHFFNKERVSKTFTDGEMTEKNTKVLIGIENYNVNIKYSLYNPTYWFNANYDLKDNICLDTINVVNLDFDISKLPLKEQLCDYKLNLDSDSYNKLCRLSFNRDFSRFVNYGGKRISLKK